MSEQNAVGAWPRLRAKWPRWLPFDAVQIRRGALFLVAIGVPVVVGAARGEPQAGLLGAGFVCAGCAGGWVAGGGLVRWVVCGGSVVGFQGWICGLRFCMFFVRVG